MKITSKIERETCIIKVSGSVDLYTVLELEDVIKTENNQYSQFILDLSETTFIDSSGLGFLIKLSRSQNSTLKVKIAAVNDSIKHLFNIKGVDGLFQRYSTVEVALDSF
jgi:HptB-dependent secretion and biofilm anti anti-sigma factor